MGKRNNWHRVLNGPPEAIGGMAGVKAYNFAEVGENEVEVEMYGQVVENRPIDWRTGKPSSGLFIVLAEFLKDLEGYKEKGKLTFRINSVGGDLFAGMAIYNRMSQLKGDTVTIVDGLAASAASVILQGGKKRKAFAGSQIMVHGASVFVFGRYNLQELKKLENTIEGGNKSVLEAYAARTGKDRAFLKGLMDKEEWMTGKEAMGNGFVDEIIETEGVKLAASADGKMVMSNGIWMSMEGFANTPQGIIQTEEAPNIPEGAIMQIERVATAPMAGAEVIEQKQGTGGQEETMDLLELKKKHPELVQQIKDEAGQEARAAGTEAQIKAEAVREERERLRQIAEIENQIADKGLVDAAKFGEKPMSAQELAFAAMKRQQAAGAQFLGAIMDDAASSGAEGVLTAPNAGGKTQEEQELEDIANGAKMIAAGWD